MNWRVYPCDLEGVGCYRIVYPYGLIDQHTSVDVTVVTPDGPLVDGRGNTYLQLPRAAFGGEMDEAAVDALAAHTHILQRPLELPYAPFAAWLATHGKRVVIDLDDFMHGVPPGNKGQELLVRSYKHSLKVLDHAFRYTSLLTVTTDKLAEIYANRVPRVEVLPNKLLRQDWDCITPAYMQDRGKLRVGWMGWLEWRRYDLRVLKPVLRTWLRKNPDVVFVNVGRPDALDYLCLPKAQTMDVPGARFPGHAHPTSEIDVGLVPLARNAFNECKSSLKSQEYGAVGAAVIGSPVGQTKEWITEENGWLAATTEQWLDALDEAKPHWREKAAANHAKSQQHMIEDHYPAWLAAHGLAVKEQVAA